MIAQSEVCNGLLSILSAEAFAVLAPKLEPVKFKAKDVLHETDTPVSHLYFLESGFASLIMDRNPPIEVSIIGSEGYIGTEVVLAANLMRLKAVAVVDGEGFTLPSKVVASLIAEEIEIRNVLSRFAHVMMIQAVSSIYAISHFSVESRLARWLLMAHDRINGNELRLTHDLLAATLCVRRPGVTVATHLLEGERFIRAKRKCITISDRKGLAKLAGKSYGLAEEEYARCFGRNIVRCGNATGGAA